MGLSKRLVDYDRVAQRQETIRADVVASVDV